MKVTVRQLAEHCGVSIGTVDRVLNDRVGVSPKTREKVRQAIHELGYSPNYLAQSLSTGKSMSIGIVLFNLSNIFFAQLSDSIVNASKDMGYFPYLMLSEKSKDQELSCVQNLISRQVDGIILFSTNNDENFVKFVHGCKIPIITVMTKLQNLVSVGIDDYTAMNDAIRYVLSKRYQRLIYISPPLSYTSMNISVQERRYQGFIDALDGTPVEHVLIADYDYLQKIDSFDLKSRKKTAFICSSDVYALNIVRHMKLRGLNSPYDYGILGFDNIETLQYVDPAISTISVPIEDIGRRAVELLEKAIVGEAITSETLPHKIVVGQTII